MPSKHIEGGDRLALALEDISRKLKNNENLKVGFFEDQTYEDGTPVAMIAAVQDYGSPSLGIPPRPFFRNWAREVPRYCAMRVRALLKENDFDVEKSLSILGEEMAEQLRQSILDTNEPPLADSTVRKKGSAKPLIDTWHMHDSVTFRVNDEDDTGDY